MSYWREGWDQNVDFWTEVFNPLGYVEFALEPTYEKGKEQLFHLAIKSAILTSAATGVWALSGGGASMGMWFGASAPTAQRMFALKAASYKEAAQFMYSHRATLARGAAYGLGAYVGYQGFRHRYATFSSTAGNDARTHVGGQMSFRNPISGM